MDNDWTFSHIGMVVQDLKKTIGHMRSLGIYTIPATEPDLLQGINPDVSGVSGSILRLDIFCGPLSIELLQPLSGDTIQQRFLNLQGEGVHHICFEVLDIAKARAAMAAKGVPVACHIRDLATYYDTAEYGKLLLELRQS
jgi:catechol 2,3-dioxygenase-like lactoylglutathione lyase family enzyme